MSPSADILGETQAGTRTLLLHLILVFPEYSKISSVCHPQPHLIDHIRIIQIHCPSWPKLGLTTFVELDLYPVKENPKVSPLPLFAVLSLNAPKILI